MRTDDCRLCADEMTIIIGYIYKEINNMLDNISDFYKSKPNDFKTEDDLDLFLNLGARLDMRAKDVSAMITDIFVVNLNYRDVGIRAQSKSRRVLRQ